MKVKHLSEEEAQEIIPELNASCGLSPYPVDGVEWWVIMIKGRAIAYVGLEISTHPGFIGLAWIPRTGVLPQYRGGGLQKRLTRAALRWARQKCHGVVTYTVSNPASANSLISCGFRSYEPQGAWAEKGAAYWRILFS